MNTLQQLRAGKLAGSTRINLSCGLTEFPPEIFDLADTLEILDLSRNELSSLPDDLPRLHKLRILFCSDNHFEHLPEVLGQCPQLSMVGFKANRIGKVSAAALPESLRWLILTDNRINELPSELGRCRQMQKLMLAGNQLQSLPEELAQCSRLELLRISANRFTSLPEWLFELPRLAWLAYADNPFCADSEDVAVEQNPIPEIKWDALQLEHKLGEGASGVIHRAQWRGSAEQQVAVKLFKGALTSDGLPHSEMAACISAGEHPNLINVLGKIGDHPAGTNGLVMSLIDAGYSNLAGPPSLESCTRDIYPAEASFTLAAILRIALGIASVAEHLHARGIMHGDLYAHNILYSNKAHALLGDFGAASFYARDDESRAQALQRIEVRAFACLLEELLQRCSETGELVQVLAELKMRCGHSVPVERPLFAEIAQSLQRLQDILTKCAVVG
jgi:hypothetical protein